ncbi:hypothetical protein MIR68_002399 [Amoeboaphelidium protococcarum]|nr:hypothetical protein MIR68_002399 [Amoeboaphelidium protococcarum]
MTVLTGDQNNAAKQSEMKIMPTRVVFKSRPMWKRALGIVVPLAVGLVSGLSVTSFSIISNLRDDLRKRDIFLNGNMSTLQSEVKRLTEEYQKLQSLVGNYQHQVDIQRDQIAANQQELQQLQTLRNDIQDMRQEMVQVNMRLDDINDK